MGKMILITGGARSGKSSLAVKLAKEIQKTKIFIATCIPSDEEMKERIRLHRQSRPADWLTVEAGETLAAALKKEAANDVVIIVDCLTLFISLLLMKDINGVEIKSEVSRITKVIEEGQATVFIVSNEVGSGLVPENKLGRDFRDIAGGCNQLVAAAANEVYFTVSGIPLKIKG